MEHVKQIFISTIVVVIMTLGLFVGIEIGESFASSSDGPYYGFVCSDTVGQCDRNENLTQCTWGPDGCETTPAHPRPD